MVYNDTTNRQGIIQEIEDLTGLGIGYISGDTNRLKDFARRAKKTMADLWFVIFNNCDGWQYDDSNHTDLPIAKTDIVSGTYLYTLPDTSLTINRVEIENANSDWIKLQVIDKERLSKALLEMDETSGTPKYYYLDDGSMHFYPKPNYSSTGGLAVYYDRAGVDFDYDDTTQTPGFASPFHYLVPLGVSIDWMKINQPDSLSLAEYKLDYANGKSALADFYSERFADKGTPTLTGKTENFE